MDKFDLHNYFFFKEAKQGGVEDDEQNQAQNSSQGMAPNPGAPASNNQTPQQVAPSDSQDPQKDQILKQKTKADSSAFSDFIGSSIAGITFKKNGANGGEISIMISKSNMPLKISWAGDKATVTKPNGNIVSL